MDWQKDLRQLDQRLAGGSVSATEYRKLRDEILAEASSGSPLVTSARKPTIPESAAAETPIGEMTQVIDRDGIAPPIPRQAEPQEPPAPPVPLPRTTWTAPTDGLDVFTVVRPTEGPPRWVIALGTLVLLALVASGVWWFALRNDGPDGNAAGQPPSAQLVVTDLEHDLPGLPGESNPNNATMSVDRALELKLISVKYAEDFRANGASQVVYKASRDNGMGLMVMVVPLASEEGATATVNGISAHLKSVGFAEVPTEIAGQPIALGRTDQQFRTYGAAYRSGKLCVQVSISQPPSDDEAALRTQFDQLLGSALTTLPAQ